VVWRCAGLRDVAEEVTQETWLVAVRRLADFDPARGAFLSWLRGVAANQVRTTLRSRARRDERPLTTNDAGSRDEAGKREQAELIARALAELTDRHEAVLRAKYLDGRSVDQIAAEWAETPKAIESVLTRAREAFRTAYEKLAGSDIVMKEPKP